MIKVTGIKIEVLAHKVRATAEFEPKGAICGVSAYCGFGSRDDAQQVLDAAVMALRELATHLPSARFGDAPAIDETVDDA